MRAHRAGTAERAALVLAVATACTSPAASEQPDGGMAQRAARLIAAYPEHLERIDGNDLVWRDGTRMPFDDGRGAKSFAEWLVAPDIEDMLGIPYRPADPPLAPPPGSDPGRARNLAFLARMYGDCRKDEVMRQLVEVAWLPKKGGGRLKATRVNGVAERLKRISAALDELPSSYDEFLKPAAGTYACRRIAGTETLSAHGFGIAIDIAVKRSDYWRWAKPASDGSIVWRNAIPMEIVRVFEAEGFIWGGRWHHFDTMHFEYRPELLAPASR